jgi:sugar lactone lactonase YvrE
MARLALALLAALVLATAGSAAPEKGKLSASLLTSPRGLVAERPWNVVVSVREGGRPVAARWVTVTIAGELGRRSFRAAATKRPGRFRARVAFPGGGIWTLGVRAGARTARLVPVEVRGAGLRIPAPFGLVAAVEHGDLIVVDRQGGGIYEVDLRTRATRRVGGGLVSAGFLGFGPGGYLYVSDERRVWRYEPNGTLTPVAGNGTRGLAGDGGPATSAQLGGHGDFAFDPAGRLYISEYDNGVRIVTPDGRIDTLAGIGSEGYSGDGGPAKAAAFGAPHGLDVLPDGTVLVADSHNGVIRRIDGATRTVTTVARGFGAPVAIHALPDGAYYVVDAGASSVFRVTADGSRTPLGSGLQTPISIAVDGAGNVYVSELERRRIRKIDGRTGRTTTLLDP